MRSATPCSSSPPTWRASSASPLQLCTTTAGATDLSADRIPAHARAFAVRSSSSRPRPCASSCGSSGAHDPRAARARVRPDWPDTVTRLGCGPLESAGSTSSRSAGAIGARPIGRRRISCRASCSGMPDRFYPLRKWLHARAQTSRFGRFLDGLVTFLVGVAFMGAIVLDVALMAWAHHAVPMSAPDKPADPHCQKE